MGLRYPLTSKKTLGYRKPTKEWMVWKDAHFVFFHLWLVSFRTGWQICCSPKPPKQHHSMVAWFFLTLSPQSSMSFGGRATVRQSNEAKIMATTISFCRRKRVFWDGKKLLPKNPREWDSQEKTGRRDHNCVGPEFSRVERLKGPS